MHAHTQVPSYVNYTYGLGLIDSQQRLAAEAISRKFVLAVEASNWTLASSLTGQLQQFLLRSNGWLDIDDIRQSSMHPYILLQTLSTYLNQPDVRAGLNVGNHTWNSLCQDCSAPLADTQSQSTLSLIPPLLDKAALL